MFIDRPIITSMLDGDFYKITMGAVVFHNFPDLEVSYEFINRGKTQFPSGFAEKLKEQVIFLALTRMKMEESAWLKSQPVIRPTYAEWLSEYRYDPSELDIRQNGGELKITIRGYWYRTILWEVPLMAIISELYFEMIGAPLAEDWSQRISTKGSLLEDNQCFWSDFGTRRRRSFAVQNEVVKTMKLFKGFAGTSNPHFAMVYNVSVIGTSAHEAVMAMECIYGVERANQEWLTYWRDYYGSQLNIALTDTFTTPVFLKGMNDIDLHDWTGYRQDSGDPYDWSRMMMERINKSSYAKLNEKLFIFSDNLNCPKFVDISKTFRPFVGKVMGGIGTNFTNDCGNNPLNIVIKLSGVKTRRGWVGAVKLSDDPDKCTGKPADIERIKKLLKI